MTFQFLYVNFLIMIHMKIEVNYNEYTGNFICPPVSLDRTQYGPRGHQPPLRVM